MLINYILSSAFLIEVLIIFKNSFHSAQKHIASPLTNTIGILCMCSNLVVACYGSRIIALLKCRLYELLMLNAAGVHSAIRTVF